MKKLFGGLNITWKALIIWAVAAGVYTGVIALIPALLETSFHDIAVSFEWWILFGIIIITNSKTPIESALKCFVFFLISQPLVYLVQVPFNRMGWGIFVYYPAWFRWTLLTPVMGYIGYYMRLEKWWGLFILGPILVFLASHFLGFAGEARSFFPNHLLSAIFTAGSMIVYSLFIFEKKSLKMACLGLSLVLLLVTGYLAIAYQNKYETYILSSHGQYDIEFDDTWTVEISDPKYGTLSIIYMDSIEDFMIKAEFTKTGDTQFTLRSPEGESFVFNLTVYRNSYDVELASGN
ncbi:MAG: hypothetical protein IJM15_01500 [Erysipelotrichaceae bacterium]|nr:hypothetical protein [Erysipelotrichaceae bacterium]